jgi:arylsulfatase A-like enzyme
MASQGIGLPYTEANATFFRNARSSGCWTLPSNASIFTGTLPHVHGATSQTRELNPNLPTLGEKLQEDGYSTYQVTANIATTDVFGLDRGFDKVYPIWQDVPAKFQRLQQFLLLVGKPRLRKKIFSKDFVNQKLSQDLEMAKTWLQNTYLDIFDKARKILRENRDKGQSSFLYLNLMETHFPYHVAPTFNTSTEGIFNRIQEVYSLFHFINQSFLKTDKNHIKDDMMSTLLERQRLSWERIREDLDNFIRELHEDQGNLVIFCSDHGDNFGDQHWIYHFSNVTDGGNRVPLLWLDHEHSQQANVDAPVSARNLYDSILDRCGLNHEGASLMREPEASVPVLQSYWYNNKGKTLPKYKYNQFCFVENDTRYVLRNDHWMMAPVSQNGKEPAFESIDRDCDPVEEFVEDKDRYNYLRTSVDAYKAFASQISFKD